MSVIINHLNFPYGAIVDRGKAKFNVWAPGVSRSEGIKLVLPDGEHPLTRDDSLDTFHIERPLCDTSPLRYKLRINSSDLLLPDPVSRFQPESLHGPSEVVDLADFKWEDQDWRGIDPLEMSIYELHVGTFTKEGTFSGASKKLPHIKKISNIAELMPSAQFEGDRNWGYDGALLFAVQHSYGGPRGLQNFVNEAHKQGMGVLVDVVFNHHPWNEHDFLKPFGPYLHSKNKTPWGDAFNLDEKGSEYVRNYIKASLLEMIYLYHVDGFRIDSAHNIFDSSEKHFLTELSEEFKIAEKALGRKITIILEDASNQRRFITPLEQGGHGGHATWNFDAHYAGFSALTGRNDHSVAYRDFNPIPDLAAVFRQNNVFSGERISLGGHEVRLAGGKIFGEPAHDLPGYRFIGALQTHDTMGNTPTGKPLAAKVSTSILKQAALMLYFSPFVPQLWQGEEFASKTPLYFFTHFRDEGISSLVKGGRESDFRKSGFPEDEIAATPAPFLEQTFFSSKIDWTQLDEKENQEVLDTYTFCKSFRSKNLLPDIFDPNKRKVEFSDEEKWVSIEYKLGNGKRFKVIHSFSDENVSIPLNKSEKFETVIYTSGEQPLNEQNKAILSPHSSKAGWITTQSSN